MAVLCFRTALLPLVASQHRLGQPVVPIKSCLRGTMSDMEMSVAETIWAYGFIAAGALILVTALISTHAWVHAYLTDHGPRFSLRLALYAMTLLAIALGWVAFAGDTIWRVLTY